MDLHALANAAFDGRIQCNPYPGRGLVIGREASDQAWLQIYWIMGRSAGSRNRVFVADGVRLATRPADAAAGTGDASLTLYEAMAEAPGVYVVTNGDQTRTVLDFMQVGESFESALETREREPDAPNYTPRISGLLDRRTGPPLVALSVLRANDADPTRTDRSAFRPAPPPAGLGYGLTTYQGDGDPLPPHRGDPLWLPLEGGPDDVLEQYWAALDEHNRVALAVKRIPDGGGASELRIRNRRTVG